MNPPAGPARSALRSPVAGIFILALCLRLALFGAGTWSPDIIDSYDTVAHNIVAGKGFSFDGSTPTVCRAPIYPVYLAGIFTATGSTSTPFTLLRVIDAVVDALTAAFVVLAARRWFPGFTPVTHTVAGLLYAVNPFAIYFTVKLGAEALQTFLFVLWLISLAPLLTGSERPGARHVALNGIFGGLLLLSKSIFLPIIVALPLAGLLRKAGRSRERIIPLVISAALALLIMAPWTIRNHAVSGRFIPVQTLAGYNFWYDFTHDANRHAAIASGDPNAVFTGGDVPLPDGRLYRPYAMSAKDDAEADALLNGKAAAWVKEHPLGMAEKMADNALGFWYVVETPRKMLVAGAYSLIMLLLALPGFLLARRHDAFGATALLILSFSFAILYSPALGVFRYSLITIPLFSIFAAAFITHMIELIRLRMKSSTTP